MAVDEELEETSGGGKDKKADKAAKKAQKAAEKAAKKEAKKADKKNKKKKGKDDSDEDSGGKLSTVLLAILIIIVWLAILCLLIKLDFGGFGSTILKPILKDIPYVNLILPETPEDTEPDDEYPYTSLADAIEQIKYLELQIQELQESGGSAEVSKLKAEIKRLKAFEEAQTKFETARKSFYEEVVFGDKSLGAEEYKKYYESIDPANAEELYKQAVQKVESDKQLEDYAATYANMKPKQAAAALEQMGDNMDLVAKILKNMDVESRAKILDAMSSAFAARITKIMEP